MKIAITGAGGLLGYHLRCKYKVDPSLQIVEIYREDFKTLRYLAAKLKGAEVVIHLAGMNRGPDEEVYQANVHLSEQLKQAIEMNNEQPTVVFSSSKHIYRDTLYGKSKLMSSSILAKMRGPFLDLVFPHIFGEFGKPFYNSAISTFSYQLANKQKPEIINDGELELVHAGDVADLILQLLKDKQTGRLEMPGRKILVSEALKILEQQNESYRNKVVPFFKDEFELKLFNTYRSYLYENFYPVILEKKTDARGSLFEAIRANNGGQAFLSTTHPGITRGNHFHFRKVERFCVIKGKASIKIRKLFSQEVKEFAVDGDSPCFIDMPTMHTHNITNVGSDELITMFWSHEFFDPQNPDTYVEAVGT